MKSTQNGTAEHSLFTAPRRTFCGDSIREIRACGNHLASQNDEAEPGELTPAIVDEEVQRINADAHNDKLKNTGELQRRRDEAAIAYERDSAFSRALYRTPSEGL